MHHRIFSVGILSLTCAFTSLISPAWSWPVWWPVWWRAIDTAYEQRNFDTISSIYNLTVYPHQVPIIQRGGAGVPPGLFSQQVVGRVDPVGEFSGFEDSIEYFFALAPLPQGNAISAAITGYQITEFSSECADVAASVVYLYSNVVNPGSPDNGKALAPIKQIAFWRFDQDGAVLKYDAFIPHLEDWVQLITPAPLSNPQVDAQSIEQLCCLTQSRCTGANAQWTSVAQCVSALSVKPYGNYDEARGDNIVCRTIHLVLVQVRPEVHCPHVGPTGGGKCINAPYSDFFADQSVFGDPTGQSFTCKI